MRFELDFPIIEDQYRAENKSIPWFSKKFPSLSFYRRMMGVVWKASRLAKKGQYDDQSWCKSSYDILKALERLGDQNRHPTFRESDQAPAAMCNHRKPHEYPGNIPAPLPDLPQEELNIRHQGSAHHLPCIQTHNDFQKSGRCWQEQSQKGFPNSPKRRIG